MKFPIVVETNLFKKSNVLGMTLCPFILVNKTAKERFSEDEFAVLLNHEKIHIRQQLELLVVPFYLFYFANYLYNRCKGKPDAEAYSTIVFEAEAYRHETELSYLKTRKWYAPFRKP